MIPGLSTYVFFDQRLHAGLLDALASSGAQTIEVFAARHHFDYTDAQQVRETAAWFRSNPVRAVLHQPVYLTDGSRTFTGFESSSWSRHVAPNLNLVSERKNARIAAMDEVKRALESAEQIPFAAVVLHLGLRDTPWDEYALEYAMTAIEHLKAFAGPLGLKVLLENLQNEVSTPEHLLEILRTGHFDNVGICLDLGHLNLTANPATKQDPAAPADAAGTRLGLNAEALSETLRLLGNRLAQVHVHDNHGPFGQVSSPTELHDEHLWPGDGTIEWPAIYGVLARVAGSVPAILEPAPTRDMAPDQVTRKAEAAFRSLLEQQPA